MVQLWESSTALSLGTCAVRVSLTLPLPLSDLGLAATLVAFFVVFVRISEAVAGVEFVALGI
jgi:hypothetical protein